MADIQRIRRVDGAAAEGTGVLAVAAVAAGSAYALGPVHGAEGRTDYLRAGPCDFSQKEERRASALRRWDTRTALPGAAIPLLGGSVFP
ncbi:hypothetical protein [Streptomyces sp. NPDC056154]|uniref:hypothetical protein n=1 Tax=unclassified Streptomyces TaxID=2593676 RepID=UPI0035DD3041